MLATILIQNITTSQEIGQIRYHIGCVSKQTIANTSRQIWQCYFKRSLSHLKKCKWNDQQQYHTTNFNHSPRYHNYHKSNNSHYQPLHQPYHIATNLLIHSRDKYHTATGHAYTSNNKACYLQNPKITQMLSPI